MAQVFLSAPCRTSSAGVTNHMGPRNTAEERHEHLAVLGMKSLSNGIIPKELHLPAEICRRFALSLPISSLMCGINSRENLRQDLAMAQHFQPITGQGLDELLAKTAQPSRDGKLEPHKTTRYGSEYHFRQHEA